MAKRWALCLTLALLMSLLAATGLCKTITVNAYEYFVEEDGWYLIEMWGGHGGNGQGAWAIAVFIPVYNEGGRGGNSGYVYGKMYLKAGQTLVYNIGTDGGESVVHNDDGGGVCFSYYQRVFNFRAYGVCKSLSPKSVS